MNPSFQDYMRYSWYLLNGHLARNAKGQIARQMQDLSPYLDSDRPLRILDLANGRLRRYYYLMNAAGHQVYGIDLINHSQLTWQDKAYRIGRFIFARQIGAASETANERKLVCGDVSTLPFLDEYFDLVVSANAFEHFLDVPAVVAELRRVLRPGGLVWVSIHLFTCLSGGHNVNWVEGPLHTLPTSMDPWDHLRQRRIPFSVPLNEWPRDQYLEAFSRYFRILKHYCTAREGEELLTPDLGTLLSAYSRDDLTCKVYVIAAGKPPIYMSREG